ncbi:MAG: penicillin acylase family protein [Calditrichaceae bacterium]|nr:penicillin acylase family protein [Calditrichaceae bacterium]RQV96954.1 MAG: penicillin acylase family protein [Calditrichota bacterium]
MKIRFKTLLIKITLGVLALLIIASVILYLLLLRSVPVTDGQLVFDALQDSVKVTFDEMGIPQIWAKKELDGYFAVGYLHAADRMFQMDITRRAAFGRISELLGDFTLEIDIQQRAIGHNKLARKFISGLSRRDRLRLDAYTDGINAYRDVCAAYPFEYQLLGLDFEQWTSEESMAMLSFQTWFANAMMSSDAFMVEAYDAFGFEKAASLKSAYPVWAPKTVSQTESTSQQQAFYESLFPNHTLPFKMSHSSNSWVIAPSKSASGHAILAGDPHLEISRLPQFWYYLGLHIEETSTDVLGISTPGLPFIAMGHNGKIAWAFTVGGIDVNEYFIEKVNPEDSSQYLTPQGWQNFEIQQEVFRVRGRDETLSMDFKITRNGPVMFQNDSLKEIYSLHWAGYDVDLAMALQAGFHLADVDHFSEFQRTVTSFGALDVNWTYADINGNIGYQLGSPIPARAKKTNNLPVPGWTDEYRWPGFYPLEKTPQSYNPQKGWLATCNNKQDESNLDYDLEGKFAADRILRINRLLETKKKFTVQDMYDFQMERTDEFLLRWRKPVTEILERLGHSAEARLMEKWDGYTGADSRETALMALFLYYLKNEIYLDDFKDEEHLIWISREHLLSVYEKGFSRWIDNIATEDHVETPEEIADRAMQKTLEKLEDQTWGDFHTLTMAHPFSIIPVLSQGLGLKKGPFPWGGTSGSLNASFYFNDPDEEGCFLSTVGPSWRFVIDFSDIDAATIVLPSGNSGNPLSPYFMNFFDRWKNGERWTVPFNREIVFTKNHTILELIPGEKL